MAAWAQCKICGHWSFRVRGGTCHACRPVTENLRKVHYLNGPQPRHPQHEQRVAAYAALVQTGYRIFEETPDGDRS